nr:Chain P, CELLULAR TUMOR ANTIGEN P53 [Homo sapiens]5UN8_E Chain E, P53 peptide [Homo sapiens]5UN8_F Chain F, P53 peptide [Homo sapiens]5UN8_G Chain G, P53 peptide [Homo sapiens]5UN8_H Chain H, P53 peptide [Homo sapiens]
QLWVDSTPPPG